MKLDGKSIQSAILQLVEDYKFEPYQVIEVIKLGVKSGFKKDFPDFRRANIQVNITETGDIEVYREYEVAEEIEDEHKQLTVDQAKEIRDDVTLEETILINVTPEDMQLSRIAAQAAAQTMKQHLKLLERERFFDRFQHKQGELLRAKVTRVTGDNVVLDIESIAVVLAPEGQIPNRMYHPGEDIFVLLKQISKGHGWVVLDITQSSADYIEAILRKLVPELENESIEIVKIARKAGKRTKILVKSNDDRIDPVWVMVGHRGDRINTVLSLLDWEKIDYIEDKQDMELLVADSLKPARINQVTIEDGKAYVDINDDQKWLAIGREAVNIRLAGQLTGFMIELR